MTQEAKISDVRVDYFTVTSTLGNGTALWVPAQKAIANLEAVGGYHRREWHFFGYQGIVLTKKNTGHFAYGEANNEEMGTIVQASGHLADRYVFDFLSPLSRWSRLDLAVDVKTETSSPSFLQGCYDWIVSNGIKARKYSLIQNNMGGTTLYVGARSSNEFGRCYDKGAELGEEEGKHWRYEIELKDTKAKHAIKVLQSMHTGKVDKSGAISSTVYDWFLKRSIPPIWRRGDTDGIDLKVTAKTSTDDQRLLWIKTSVAPSVKEMLSVGKVEVLDALGITDFYRVERRRI